MTQSVLLSEPNRLIPAIVLTLKQILSQSQKVQGQRCIFDLKNKPTLSYAHYLLRIFNFMECSHAAYVYAVINIENILSNHPTFRLTQRNIHRLLFTSIVISAKFVDDHFYKNSFYASIGGIPLETLNQMEEEMLVLLDFHCPIDPEVFNSYLIKLQNLLQSKIELKKSQQRPKISIHRKDSNRTSNGEQHHRKKPLRQKRERSREKNIQRYQDTQESRQMEEYP